MAKDRKYWNDHLSDIRLESSGQYSYQGAFYKVEEISTRPDKQADVGKQADVDKQAQQGDLYKKFLIYTWIPIAISIIALILAGMFPATGAMNTWYVLIPYGASVVSIGFITYYMARLTKGMLSLEYRSGRDEGMVREYIYQKTWPRINPFTKALIVFTGITLFGEVFYLIKNGKGEYFGGAILLLMCMAIVVASSLALLHRSTTIKWRKIAEN